MLGHIEHGVFHFGGIVFVGRMVDRIISGESGGHQGFLYMHTIKFYPGIFPGMQLIGGVGGHLSGYDQKSLPAVDMIDMFDALGIPCRECAAAGNDIVEQIVAADMRTKGMHRFVLGITILIHTQVDKTLIFQNIITFFHSILPLIVVSCFIVRKLYYKYIKMHINMQSLKQNVAYWYRFCVWQIFQNLISFNIIKPI